MGLPKATMLLREAAAPIRIIDIGAMSLGREQAHIKLLQAGKASLLGFEPVEAECDKLNTQHPAQRYLPYAVGNGQAAELRECNYAMTSSLYEPNTPLLEIFQALAELTMVVKRTRLETKRLDDIPEAAGADYLKMDVQGAELDILRGAQRALSSVLVVHTEVAFVEMYRGQPLFADVDAELRRHGFMFHRFMGIAGRAFKPFVKDNNLGDTFSQQLWADAVYVRDLMRLDALAPDQLVKLALIVNECYVSFDLAAYVLRQHDRMTGATLGRDFTTAVTDK